MRSKRFVPTTALCRSSCAGSWPRCWRRFPPRVNDAEAEQENEDREVDEREEGVLLHRPEVVNGSGDRGNVDESMQPRPPFAEPLHPAFGRRQREWQENQPRKHSDEDVSVLEDF